MTDNEAIAFFTGRYRFLSNFYPCEITYQDCVYANTECAYQAHKFPIEYRYLFANITNPGVAKRLARTHQSKQLEDFHERKLQLMEDLLREKFAQNWFKTKLLATGTRPLIEGNHWNDTFWGVCNGVGENNLGKLLMKIRSELAS